MSQIRSIDVIALAALGQGLSGGDRLFIEFSRRWSKLARVSVIVWEEGLMMCKRENLDKHVTYNLIKVGNVGKLGFFVTYFYRIILGIKFALEYSFTPNSIVYSASEFWMDSLTAFLIKLRYPKVIWAAAWYQTAPNPIRGFAKGRYRLRALAYWLAQLPIKPIINKFADHILVNNSSELSQFSRPNSLGRVHVVIGAVDTDKIEKFMLHNPKPKDLKYLAVFQGRFHPQKGVVELVRIWKIITTNLPKAKLAMIGDGPLMDEVKREIKSNNLENNIDLFGYLSDGDKKYKIFNNSKFVLHPAFYDSGGMASAEAMAFGLPCIGFDLESYYSYYPQGMLKAKIGDLDGFAKLITEMNSDKSKYKIISKQAEKLIFSKWSWNQRALEVFNNISKL